ncbi:MAG: class I SAM-dependent methyltransferase [Thermoguttaceae bacterium]|jgi:SAM-dependent methyltransferase|nr:class I SAM-dependent methyltransferase [Thermoguttaceae bacterium]
MSNWYDYPQYYDLAFRSETAPEADFVEAAARKYCPFPVQKLLEPACGTGRLLAELAARGYELTGLDLSRPSLGYLRRRLRRRGLNACVFEADMADFRLRRPVDLAYCTFDAFRHLLSEADARRHLECVAESLRPGGIYILGIHLLPPDASEECIERWTERRGGTQVTVTLRVLATDRRRRLETLRVSLLVRTRAGNELRLRHEFPFRMYTAAQFRRLLRSVPSLKLLDVYDFWYEIDQPLKLNDEMNDTVFILQKLDSAWPE